MLHKGFSQAFIVLVIALLFVGASSAVVVVEKSGESMTDEEQKLVDADTVDAQGGISIVDERPIAQAPQQMEQPEEAPVLAAGGVSPHAASAPLQETPVPPVLPEPSPGVVHKGTQATAAPYLLEFREVERIITVLHGDGKAIGPEQYQNLSARLDALSEIVATEEDQARIVSLRAQLEAVNSDVLLGASTESVLAATGEQGQYPDASGHSSPPQKTCTNNPSPVFTRDITDMTRISQITPPGTIFDAGQVVKSHSYVWIGDGGVVPVYAPVDMELSAGAHYTEQGVGQYLLFFEVSCEVEIKFDHILSPVESIRAVLAQEPGTDSRTNTPTEPVVFQAGDLIANTSGTSGAHNWDFGVYNTTLFPNPATDGVANLAEIDQRADCGYDYFSEGLRGIYRNLFIKEIGGSSAAIPYCDF